MTPMWYTIIPCLGVMIFARVAFSTCRGALLASGARNNLTTYPTSEAEYVALSITTQVAVWRTGGGGEEEIGRGRGRGKNSRTCGGKTVTSNQLGWGCGLWHVWGVSWWWSLRSASEGWWATPYPPPQLKCKKKHKVVVNTTVGCARAWDLASTSLIVRYHGLSLQLDQLWIKPENVAIII